MHVDVWHCVLINFPPKQFSWQNVSKNFWNDVHNDKLMRLGDQLEWIKLECKINLIPPPLMSCAIISRKKSLHREFSWQVLRNFWRYCRDNWPYGSEVMQHYIIKCRLKIWEFFGFVYKIHGKSWLFMKKTILRYKMHSLLSYYSENDLYLLIFNT